MKEWQILAVSMVTYDAFLIRVVHAGETHKDNTSHAKQERCSIIQIFMVKTVISRISRLKAWNEIYIIMTKCLKTLSVFINSSQVYINIGQFCTLGFMSSSNVKVSMQEVVCPLTSNIRVWRSGWWMGMWDIWLWFRKPESASHHQSAINVALSTVTTIFL